MSSLSKAKADAIWSKELSEVKALNYGSQTLSERIMLIIKERNDLGTPQTLD